MGLDYSTWATATSTGDGGYYAGGGGGSGYNNIGQASAGGAGGGGDGTYNTNPAASPANTGGGGAGGPATRISGAGGSGIVIIRYLT